MSHALNQHRASTWILSFVRTRSRRIGRRFPGGYHASGTSHVRRGVWDARGLKRKLGEMNDDGDDDIRQGKGKDKDKANGGAGFSGPQRDDLIFSLSLSLSAYVPICLAALHVAASPYSYVYGYIWRGHVCKGQGGVTLRTQRTAGSIIHPGGKLHGNIQTPSL
ncbi:hypothetical protein K445DRAFT_309131 [Daldinia sp. EC12]|nr:hypothetical protein K445DRAFT_309131 [Daldinia sp. EC12]